MIPTFSTSFPDWLLFLCILALICWLAFIALRFLAAIFYVLFIMLKYALTGRWKEYLEKCKTDPNSLR